MAGTGGFIVTCADETECVGGEGDWLAHSPEVSGSNPVPATSGNGPGGFSEGRFHAACERFVNVSFAHLTIVFVAWFHVCSEAALL
jgi:hypothetical protein